VRRVGRGEAVRHGRSSGVPSSGVPGGARRVLENDARDVPPAVLVARAAAKDRHDQDDDGYDVEHDVTDDQHHDVDEPGIEYHVHFANGETNVRRTLQGARDLVMSKANVNQAPPDLLPAEI
jgi:hypothetical protein